MTTQPMMTVKLNLTLAIHTSTSTKFLFFNCFANAPNVLPNAKQF